MRRPTLFAFWIFLLTLLSLAPAVAQKKSGEVKVPASVKNAITAYLRAEDPLLAEKLIKRALKAIKGKLPVAVAALKDLKPLMRARAGYQHGLLFKFGDLTWKYSISLPKGYDCKKRFPVLVLPDHGSVSDHEGLGWWLDRKHAKEFIIFRPVIVRHQSDRSRFARSQFFERDQDIGRVMKEALRFLRLNYRVAHDRFIMTGLSQAGYYTWYYAVSFPDQFAGIVPESSGGTVVHAAVMPLAKNLAHLPVRILHAKGDAITPYADAKAMKAAIEQAQGNVELVTFTKKDWKIKVPRKLHPTPHELRAANVLPWGLEQRRKIPASFERVLRYAQQTHFGRFRVTPPATPFPASTFAYSERDGLLSTTAEKSVSYLVSPEDVLSKKKFQIKGKSKKIQPKADIRLLLESFKVLGDPDRLAAAEIRLK